MEKIEIQLKKLKEEEAGLQGTLREVNQQLQKERIKQDQAKNELQEILAKGKDSQKLERSYREAGERIWILGTKISGIEAERKRLDSEIVKLESERMSEIRGICEAKAKTLLSGFESQKKEILDLYKKIVGVYVLCDQNIPTKRIQISSKKLVKVEKRVTEKIPGKIIFHPRGNEQTFKDNEKTLTATIELHRLPRFLKDGWEPLSSQDLSPEELTSENSIITKSFGLPEIIEGIESLNVSLNFNETMGQLSQKDLLNFLNEIQGGDDQ